MSSIQLDAVQKAYGDVTAIQNLDLEVGDQEVFGFLGPNGAGKSTTINILLDFVRPTAGTATVLGHNAQTETEAVHERVGVLPEGVHLYERLTGREHIEFAMRTKRVGGDPEAILDRVGMTEAADRKTGGYSKGMRQRLALGVALVGEPDLLILDEPSTGLDPNGAREMREIVREENERGAAVFFSSHILEQVEAVCDRVGIMHQGELVSLGTVDELRTHLGSQAELTITLATTDTDVVAAVEACEGVTSVKLAGTDLLVTCAEPGAKAEAIKTVHEHGHTIADIALAERSLEDLFAELTNDQEAVA